MIELKSTDSYIHDNDIKYTQLGYFPLGLIVHSFQLLLLILITTNCCFLLSVPHGCLS